ncbi:MAG: Gfo/Idh/MocA family oxidoreductase [Pigmentiphaga sp.]|nr:Gfo/Idh/MocA family oxidoreductase [Pigmentiphaga sp.]
MNSYSLYINSIKTYLEMKRQKLIGILTISLFAVFMLYNCGTKSSDMITLKTPQRPTGQTDVLELRCDPIPIVRVGFIGIGMRGSGAVKRFTYLDGVQIKAICDMEQYNLDRAQKMLTDANLPKADEYTEDENAWKKLCERDDIDLVYICSDWKIHTPISVYAMEHGKHVAVEVPAALTIDECWQLVNTAEKTRKHCMMLENCVYDFFESATLNMAQQGLFGEIMHVEGAYIHDLRQLNFNDRLSENASYNPGQGDDQKLPGLSGYYDHWRLDYNAAHTGNAYPTHGLGPVCQILNIHRGDKMNYLVSVSSDQQGMTDYAKERFGEDSPEAKRHYAMGDMNTTLIRTEKGKTILVQHDVTNPRPYSRIHLISGTKGFAEKYPMRQIALEPHGHYPLSDNKRDSLLAAYEFPFVTRIKEQAKKVGGHGGMDFIMDYRLIYCLQNGLPLDQDVYDAAEWSCLVELTELSVKNNSATVKIPDFTRGSWNKLQGLKLAE